MLRVLAMTSILVLTAGAIAHAAGTSSNTSSATSSTSLRASDVSVSNGAPSLRATIPDTKSPSDDSKRLTGKWSLYLQAEHNQSDLADRRTRSVFGVAFDLKYQLTDYLYVKAVPRVYSENGHIQTESATTGNASAFAVSEATANFHYEEAAILSGGALNHSDQISELLISKSLSFPGARVGFQVGEQKSSYAGIYAEGAVPTSSSLTSNTRDFEKTPSFMLGGVRGQWKSNGFTITPRINYFAYSSLPQSVAQASGLLGNSTDTAVATNDSRFVYDYRGFEGGGKMRYIFTRKFAAEVRGAMIQNQSAPSGFNKGMIGTGKVEMIAGKFIYSPAFTVFRMEPDSAVSYYNDSTLQTNRVGYMGELAVQYMRLFKFKVNAGERGVIYESASQGREKFVSIGLETLDAIF